MDKQRLVIIGAGFAGLNLAKNIDRKRYDITIVDRNNYHSFPPLFYQVASSGLEPASISFPLRREFSRHRWAGIHFHMGEVSAINISTKEIITGSESISYDILVIAAGTTNNFFNIPELQNRVYTMKSTSEAIRLRNKILYNLERAAICRNEAHRRRMLTFVIVGGGPTGVEIAGALGEMKRFVLHREYPTIKPEELRVILIESSDSLLNSMSPASGQDATKALSQLMVELHLGIGVKDYSDSVVTLSDGSTLECETVIWTAGVRGENFTFIDREVELALGNRLPCDQFNAVKGLTDVYAIGDISLIKSNKYPKGHAQLAQVAIQQGRNLAYNLNHPQGRKSFEYVDKGSMATIGRNHAVVDFQGLHLCGIPAWLTWMFVHLISLMGMRNKSVVLINWIWNYFTFSSGLRLLLRPARNPMLSLTDSQK